MNSKTAVTCSRLIAQLTHHLMDDPECVALLEKLSDRLNVLTLGEFDAQKALANPAALVDLPLSLEECLQMTEGALILLTKATNKTSEKRAEYIELIDTHHAYVKALEKRCHALTDEYKKSGSDLSKYPEIPKP